MILSLDFSFLLRLLQFQFPISEIKREKNNNNNNEVDSSRNDLRFKLIKKLQRQDGSFSIQWILFIRNFPQIHLSNYWLYPCLLFSEIQLRSNLEYDYPWYKSKRINGKPNIVYSLWHWFELYYVSFMCVLIRCFIA